jgi:hypothetical protein
VHAGAGIAAHVRRVLVEHHQLFRILGGQLPQHDLVEQCEDRGVRADAERQREDGDGGKEAIATKAAKRELQVG